MDDEATRPDRDANYCFGCAEDNPIGLHLQFERSGPDEVRSEFTLREEFCGWRGVAHGGIVALLMDEVTSWCLAVCRDEARFASRELSVRFLRPTPTGQPLVATGRVVADHGKTVGLVGEVRRPDGRLTARGRVEIVRFDEEDYARFTEKVKE